MVQNIPSRLSSTGFGIGTLCQNIGIRSLSILWRLSSANYSIAFANFRGHRIVRMRECRDSTDGEDQVKTCPERKTASKRLLKKYIT